MKIIIAIIFIGLVPIIKAQEKLNNRTSNVNISDTVVLYKSNWKIIGTCTKKGKINIKKLKQPDNNNYFIFNNYGIIKSNEENSDVITDFVLSGDSTYFSFLQYAKRENVRVNGENMQIYPMYISNDYVVLNYHSCRSKKRNGTDYCVSKYSYTIVLGRVR